MQKIKISSGHYVLVDDTDYEVLNNWKWSINEYSNKDVRAVRRQKIGKKFKKIWMHRFIMNTPESMECDHINRNTLDNRRENLRNCTRSENQRNTKLYRNNSSGVRGIYFSQRINKWMVAIQINKKRRYLGCYKTKEEARDVYNTAAIKYHGDFKFLNV